MELVMARMLKRRARSARTRNGRGAALVTGLLAGVAAAAAGAAPAGAAPPCAIAPGAVGSPTSVTCGFTGGAQSWTVPPGVTEATFDLSGSQGGSSLVARGGKGARAVATLPVTPGDVYEIRVGGVGIQAFSCSREGAGGYNGGGTAGTFCDPSWMFYYQGMGGGGATDVRLGGTALADRVLVAAGGGGSAALHYSEGGAGGGLAGLDGAAAAGGAIGRGATQLAGGAGSSVISPGGATGTDGALGVGGTGGAGAASGGGGGGGGLYGGGGGGTFPCVGPCGGDGGGGGGSSYGPAGATFTAGAQSGAGRAEISYTTVNPPPACDAASAETGGGRPVTATLACADQSGATFTYEIAGGPAKGTLGSIDQTTGRVLYTPNAGQVGTDTFTYRVRGVNGPSATATVTVTLLPPPVCESFLHGTGHGIAAAIELSCSDPAAVDLTYAVATQPAHGTLSAFDEDAGTVTYTPDPAFSGSDQFTYRATSDNGTSQASTVTVAVDPPPPTCAPRSETTTASTALPITLSCGGTASFPNAYAIVGQPQHGAISGLDPQSGALTYTPETGYVGPDSFSFRATNDGGSSTTETVTIDVAQPPAPECDAVGEQVDANGSASVQLTCTTTAGFPMTHATVDAPAHGTLSGLDPDAGTVTYTPAVGYEGEDSFTYTATNATGTSSAATATITVDAPPAPSCAPAQATVGDAGSVMVQLTCTGAEGFPMAYAIASGPQHGSLSALDSTAGTVRYTPQEGFGGADGFSFTAENAGGASTAAAVTVAVLAPPAFAGEPGEGGSVTSARPALAFAGGFAPGGFECRVDGGGWSACSSPFTVPDALARGEHAVAVRARGDGGELSTAASRTLVVDGVSETVAPGGTVSSDVPGRGPGQGNPLEVTVTSPAGGQVTLRELAAGAVTSPSGYEVLGRGFEVHAPGAPDDTRPLRIELRIDAAAVPAGVGLDQLVALRDGVPVAAACAAADRLGPTPCIASRTREGDAIVLVVLTDHASTWAVGRTLPRSDDDRSGDGGSGDGGRGGDGDGRSGPAPAPDNRFTFPRVSATRAGVLVARFAFPRAGRAVLVGTARSARTPFTSAGALNRRSAAARQALFSARTVRSPRARAVTVRLTPTARGRALLRRDGRLAARLWVSFAPTGGTARAASRAVVVALRSPRR
jgi:Glycine rich protein/Bacterial Ig domain